jgi:hypothetical protein
MCFRANRSGWATSKQLALTRINAVMVTRMPSHVKRGVRPVEHVVVENKIETSKQRCDRLRKGMRE